jgi:hypothetical protein
MSTDVKTKLISRKHVKAYALFVAGSRAHRFTRVSGEFLIKCEGELKHFIRTYIGRLPSKGKTIL